MRYIYLNESEDSLTPEKMEEFEQKIGMILPTDFKDFYLKANGGYPEEELYTKEFIEIDPDTKKEFKQQTDVEHFLSLNEIEFEYGDILDEKYIPDVYVPFAMTSFGNLLLIRLDKSDACGSIYFSNHDKFDSAKNQFTISKICDTFEEFIESLNTDSTGE